MGPDSGRRGLFGALPFVLPQDSTDLFGAGSASARRTFPQPGVGMRSSASSRPEIGQFKRLVLRIESVWFALKCGDRSQMSQGAP
jgi:hypothetical protein